MLDEVRPYVADIKLGDSFDLREFHRQVLEIGPVQFPVLAKYMQPAADSSS